MREVKFRGKSLPIGNHVSRWVYGHYFVSPLTDENSGAPMEAGWFFLTGEKRHCIVEEGVVYVVDEKSVSQFIGLPDKNLKEIYEGDFLATWNDNAKYGVWTKDVNGLTSVIWSDAYSAFIGSNWMWKYASSNSVYDLRFCEVAGNVYENPELLT